MSPPIVQSLQFLVDQIYNCFAFMNTVQFRGIPLTGYLVGLVVLSVGIDYIFR